MKRIAVLVLLAVVLLSLSACEEKQVSAPRSEDIRAICELATLECYYNNVAKIDKKAENIFQPNRKMWIEYEGKATIGIDMSKVEIQVAGDAVNVKMPKAEVLSLDYTFRPDSYVASEDGWWIGSNKISTEDQQAGVVEGQSVMEEAINNNSGIFVQAEDRAKELIVNYITELGNATGKTYTITIEMIEET